MDSAVWLRAVERIIGVGIGGLCVYLGYKLFLHLPEVTDSKGKVVLPGGISIYLSRVGPGVFFALFGALLVAASFYFGLTTDDKNGHLNYAVDRPERPPVQSGTAESDKSGIHGYPVGEGLAPEIAIKQLTADMQTLNQIAETIKLVNKDENTRNKVDDGVMRIKLSMIALVWSPGWGDFKDFRNWVNGGQDKSEMARWHDASMIFNAGR
ncbi:MAG: hypothetical protein ABSG38_12185 [Spirochaetia bacterium]|jgi:hypothetical protein